VKVVSGSSASLAQNVENLTYAGDYAGIAAFAGIGNRLANILTGGNGVDSISGRAGDDTLNGLKGDDRLAGDEGNDTFVFAAEFGNDTITAFDAGPAGGRDVLDVSAFGITASNFVDRVTIMDLGADTLVTIDGNAAQTIRLIGIGDALSVTREDFLLFG
jgi:Ca2+-binding RTX toxin-like protein